MTEARQTRLSTAELLSHVPHRALHSMAPGATGQARSSVTNPADGDEVIRVANGTGVHALQALDAAVRAQPAGQDGAAQTGDPHACGTSPDARTGGTHRPRDDAGKRQAADRSARPNSSCRPISCFGSPNRPPICMAVTLCRVARRFSGAGRAAADWAVPADHAVELSAADDRAKGGGRAGGRLHDDHQVRQGNAHDRRTVVQILHDAGFPPGTANLIHTQNSSEISETLIADPSCAKSASRVRRGWAAIIWVSRRRTS